MNPVDDFSEVFVTVRKGTGKNDPASVFMEQLFTSDDQKSITENGFVPLGK
jgi:hypothetical protein